MTTTVCIGYDFDAVSVWIHAYDAGDSPTKLSRGVFGADVGVPRLLDIHDRVGVPATFFTPGHTIESFPEAAGEIWDRGYDVQHHGWTHTAPSAFESRDAEREDLVRGIEAIRDLTGRVPTGYRSPAWDFSAHTLDLLRELGFEWDSSLMGHDVEPYYLREGWRAPRDGPFDRGTETEVLELPISWDRDDWLSFQYASGDDSRGGRANETRVFDAWREQFDWVHDHVADGLIAFTFHPQIAGRPPRPAKLEELFRYIQSQPDAEFRTFAQVASDYSA